VSEESPGPGPLDLQIFKKEEEGEEEGAKASDKLRLMVVSEKESLSKQFPTRAILIVLLHRGHSDYLDPESSTLKRSP
jgi:hypothetical protein